MLPNYIDKFFTKSGRYFIMLGQALKRPQKMRVFSKLYFREVDDLGFNSMGIVAFLSFFVGAVVALQMAFNLDGSVSYLSIMWLMPHANRLYWNFRRR